MEMTTRAARDGIETSRGGIGDLLTELARLTGQGDPYRRATTNKSAPEEFPLAEIDLLVGWRAGEDEYLFTKAVAMVREWLLDAEEKDRLRDVLKEILAEAGPAGNRPLD